MYNQRDLQVTSGEGTSCEQRAHRKTNEDSSEAHATLRFAASRTKARTLVLPFFPAKFRAKERLLTAYIRVRLGPCLASSFTKTGNSKMPDKMNEPKFETFHSVR